jgi:hypothetical protein
MASVRIGLLVLTLLALMILASRFALVLHEVGGHAVPAKILGARRVEIRLSPMGGGYVSPAFPRPLSAPAVVVFDLGGIAINLITGAGAWFWARRLKSRGLWYLALLFLGVGSVAGATTYLTCGFYYGAGDPMGFAPTTQDIRPLQWAWVLFLPAAAAVGWFGPRHYLDFLAGHFATDTARRRLLASAGTVGLAGLAYFGLWAALRDPTIEGSTRTWRIEQEIARETIARAKERAAQPPPPPNRAPAPPPAPIPVRPEEVAHRVPAPIGPLVLYAAFAVAGILSISRTRPPAAAGNLAVPPPVAFGLAGLAATVVGLFRLLG